MLTDEVLRRTGFRGGDLESRDARRPLRGGEREGETRLAARRGGVRDIDLDLDKDLDRLRPRRTSFPLRARGGVNERDRARCIARGRENERDLE